MDPKRNDRQIRLMLFPTIGRKEQKQKQKQQQNHIQLSQG